MEDRKYKHWVFTYNDDGFLDARKYKLTKFLREFCTSYAFQHEEGEKTGRTHLQGYFSTKIRKRQPSLIREFKAFFELMEKETGAYYSIKDLTIQRMMGSKEEAIAYCTKTDTRVDPPETFGVQQSYDASDLDIFKKENVLYEWQKRLMKILFINDVQYKLSEPDDREIIWIYDTYGNSGKSKFVKHICYELEQEACKLPFGTSAQLRSACISAGPKELYFIDVPRTLGKEDRIYDIISVIEDIKNGFVVSSMYGKHEQLMFKPPHIVVFSNMQCPPGSLSGDRVKEYSIDFSKDLIQ